MDVFTNYEDNYLLSWLDSSFVKWMNEAESIKDRRRRLPWHHPTPKELANLSRSSGMPRKKVDNWFKNFRPLMEKRKSTESETVPKDTTTGTCGELPDCFFKSGVEISIYSNRSSNNESQSIPLHIQDKKRVQDLKIINQDGLSFLPIKNETEFIRSASASVDHQKSVLLQRLAEETSPELDQFLHKFVREKPTLPVILGYLEYQGRRRSDRSTRGSLPMRYRQ